MTIGFRVNTAVNQPRCLKFHDNIPGGWHLATSWRHPAAGRWSGGWWEVCLQPLSPGKSGCPTTLNSVPSGHEPGLWCVVIEFPLWCPWYLCTHRNKRHYYIYKGLVYKWSARAVIRRFSFYLSRCSTPTSSASSAPISLVTCSKVFDVGVPSLKLQWTSFIQRHKWRSQCSTQSQQM